MKGKTTIPMLDLGPLHRPLAGQIAASIGEIVERGDFIRGAAVERFEAMAADYLGVRHAIGLASGTDALMLALRAAGVGPGDEVITTPFSYWATAEAIWQVGARAVYVDIDPRDMNLDPRAVEAAITARSRAILPVHIFGQCADMDAIRSLADFHSLADGAGLALIEDAAQAFGARYRGRMAGSFGLAGCFSFYPSKPLGAMGDGGLLATNDEDFAARVRKLANHGTVAMNRHDRFACSSRLDSIQAAILAIKLPLLDAHLAERRRLAARYCEGLAGLPLQLPLVLPEREHCFAQFTIRCDDPDGLAQHLAQAGIASARHYPVPLYAQAAQGNRYHGLHLPEAETCTASCLSLPLYQGLREDEQAAVCERIATFFDR